jgi:hypothetical protein
MQYDKDAAAAKSHYLEVAATKPSEKEVPFHAKNYCYCRTWIL